MLNRYKIQQDKGKYCLKGCDDGDLVDYSAYAALEARCRADQVGVLNERKLRHIAEDRIAEFEATLRNVQSALKSGSIECDDMRVIDNMINDALAGFTPETDCGHGQITETGCPSCDRKLGYETSDDFTPNRSSKP